MGFQIKIVLLSVIPSLVAMSVAIAMLYQESNELIKEQSNLVRTEAIDVKKREQKSYMAGVMRDVRAIYDSGMDDAATKENVKSIIRSWSPGGMDGRLFLTDYSGRNLLRDSAKSVAEDASELEPSSSRELLGIGAVPQLLSRARAGGGFEQYLSKNPKVNTISQTLGYVELLDRWNWVIGMEVYLNDIDQNIEKLRALHDKHLSHVIWQMLDAVLIAVVMTCMIMFKLNEKTRGLADVALTELNQRIFKSQEEERAQVARELHDGISQLIVSAKFAFESANTDPSPETKQLTFQRGMDRLHQAIQEIRLVSHALRSPLLDDLGLSVALTELCREFAERTGLEIKCKVPEDETTVPEHVAIALYRVTQEALSNIDRHAAATRALISFTVERGFAVLSIADNGRGIDHSEVCTGKRPGLGLRNMRERVSAFNGRVSIASSEKGTTILVRVML
ncbi:histidine kinase-, DNA gyrase B-, and HSP90-like ATPase family protein [Collimonas fungivorans]|uniref:histidine kinase n=1 Tax=Collimonas fungivorans TaxID=158899 RepID=A0A127P5V0_9BURK|nr:cache domain-containing protein [Collimonas fungivorans]AMO93212.1 histidine kinase-, DNA gyrase B-, and HSP90-like ATPase family protein [Collimonas fungivorans]